jgi:hypothetical protein
MDRLGFVSQSRESVHAITAGIGRAHWPSDAFFLVGCVSTVR